MRITFLVVGARTAFKFDQAPHMVQFGMDEVFGLSVPNIDDVFGTQLGLYLDDDVGDVTRVYLSIYLDDLYNHQLDREFDSDDWGDWDDDDEEDGVW